jgi:hypothetical protein
MMCRDGVWTHRDSGIGGSIDSFFEYLLKVSSSDYATNQAPF